jgi:peptidoglycan-associated lipoprotein
MRWLTSVFLVLALVFVVGGCKGKRGGTRGIGPDSNIGGVIGSPVYEEPLSDRPELLDEFSSQFEPVYFAYDSSQINPSERDKIETVSDYLQDNSAYGVIVEGHCDERGSHEYNLALGERRALAVRAYLIGLGLDATRIQTKSYGEENPAAFGHDEESWRLNRRAVFVLFQ